MKKTHALLANATNTGRNNSKLISGNPDRIDSEK